MRELPNKASSNIDGDLFLLSPLLLDCILGCKVLIVGSRPGSENVLHQNYSCLDLCVWDVLSGCVRVSGNRAMTKPNTPKPPLSLSELPPWIH